MCRSLDPEGAQLLALLRHLRSHPIALLLFTAYRQFQHDPKMSHTMQLHASIAPSAGATHSLGAAPLGALPAPLRSMNASKAFRTQIHKQMVPSGAHLRQSRIVPGAIKASAATEAPPQATSERPMNIVFVSAEVRWAICVSGINYVLMS